MEKRTRGIQKAPLVDLFSSVDFPRDMVSLGQGIPFFGPPIEVINTIADGIKRPSAYRYTADAGVLTLRKKIAQKLFRQHALSFDPNHQVVVTVGANQAFMNAILSVTNTGDEIILFRPTYFNYVMGVQLAGCIPIICETDENFHPRIQDLQKKLSEKTKAVVTISPNNPTGAVYTADELKKINEFCASHDLFHISDEVYEYFVYDDVIHRTPLVFDADLDHTISLFSFSKAFGMSGLRVGYMMVPQQIYDDVLKVQDTIGICAPALSQMAAEAAIQMDDRYVSRFLPVFQKNREMMRNLLSHQSKVKCSMLNGAYYVFLSYNGTLPSWEVSKQLVEEYKVMVLPGSVFDMEYSLRVSYGNLKTKDFEKGLYRLVDGLNDIL